jgi:hypothetical protein
MVIRLRERQRKGAMGDELEPPVTLNYGSVHHTLPRRRVKKLAPPMSTVVRSRPCCAVGVIAIVIVIVIIVSCVVVVILLVDLCV